MNYISHRQLSLFIIVYIKLTYLNGLESNKQLLHLRVNQKILSGPYDINTYLGETIQFPCIVSKQPDAIVTWCWNDFCTLGKTHLLAHQTTQYGLISIYQYIAYPRFRLIINERLNHYNLSIMHVTNNDEGLFQCQIQRTMRANEARSERVRLTVIDPPLGQPSLLLPRMPLKQGQSANITCLSSPSKPASNLILYKNEQIINNDLKIFYQLDENTNKNLTKILYRINDPDSSWDNAIIRCKQIYNFTKNSLKDISEKIEVYYKPKVRIESQNRSPLTMNSTATFRCIVQGNPQPEFRWFANSMDLTSLTSSVINIPLSKHVHNHSIGCMARNAIGITNTTIRLLIRYPPSLLVHPPKLVILDLHSKSSLNFPTIRCIVDSYPRARISWYRYGELINEGSSFNLSSITKRDHQGIYSYRIETEGYETIKNDFIIYIKGKPLIYIQEYNQIFECRVYSSSPIIKISWRLNDQPIETNHQISITTTCEHYNCISKLFYDYRKMHSSSTTFQRLSCLGENEYGIEQSRLYPINSSNVNIDPSTILVIIILITFILILFSSLIAIYCCCRIRHIRKRHERLNQKRYPVVYDEHYSINELIQEVGSLKTCDISKLQSSDRFLTTLFNNNTKTLLDDLSNESSTNSSGFHSKSTTTLFINEYSSKLNQTNSGISPLYKCQYQMDV